MTDERWRHIPFPGVDHYEVSTLGRVRNIDTGQVLKPWKGYGKNGKYYLKVSLYDRGERKCYFVHRLVAFAFFEIDHQDRDRGNNRWDNLEIVTPKENRDRWPNVVTIPEPGWEG